MNIEPTLIYRICDIFTKGLNNMCEGYLEEPYTVARMEVLNFTIDPSCEPEWAVMQALFPDEDNSYAFPIFIVLDGCPEMGIESITYQYEGAATIVYNRTAPREYTFIGIDYGNPDTFSFQIRADRLSDALEKAQIKLRHDFIPNEDEAALTLIIDPEGIRYKIIDGKAYLHT